jgi:hypothetical protein
MSLAPDGSRAVAAHYRVLQHPMRSRDRLRLRGLDASARYRVTVWTSFDAPAGSFERGGDDLMSVGLSIEPLEPMPEGIPNDGVRYVGSDFNFRLYDVVRL